jgi:predicted MFS family arabinose efflux permease
VGGFAMCFPVYLSTMSVLVFHLSAQAFGILSSVLAVGTMIGALLAARRERPGLATLAGAAAVIGGGLAVAAMAPSVWLFGAALVLVGMATLTFTTATNAAMQLTAAPAMRGRVLAIRIAILDGCTPVGALLVGWVADVCGPRVALCAGAAAATAAAAAATLHLYRGHETGEAEPLDERAP